MRLIGMTKIQKSILKPFGALAMYPRAVRGAESCE